MNRVPASARLRRMLSILPWIMSQPGGASIDEICRRFDVSRDQLLADLDVVWMVGVHPYTPDTLVDVQIDQDRVTLRLADYFRRPLRMTPDQALAIVATGRSLATAPGTDPEGPLSRAIAKVADVLGIDPTAVDVQLGEAASATLATLTRATDEHRRVELDYYSYGRDELSVRVVEPHRVYADQGQWYLEAYCQASEGERIFRLDRVREARPLDETFAPPEEVPELGLFHPTPDTPRVTLELEPEARWVIDQYPSESFEDLECGRVRVVMAIAAPRWLERLLLRLGPAARLVEAPPELAGSAAGAAARVLARYRPLRGDEARVRADHPVG